MFTFCQYIQMLTEEKNLSESEINEERHTLKHGDFRGTEVISKNDKNAWNTGKDKYERRAKKQTRANGQTTHLVAGSKQSKEFETNFKTGVDLQGHQYVYNALHDNSNFRGEMKKDDPEGYRRFLNKDRKYHHDVRQRLYDLRDSGKEKMKTGGTPSSEERAAMNKLAHIQGVDLQRQANDEKLRNGYSKALDDLVTKLTRLAFKGKGDVTDSEKDRIKRKIQDAVREKIKLNKFTAFRADYAMPYAIDRADSRERDVDDKSVIINKYNMTDVEQKNIKKMGKEVEKITDKLAKKIMKDDDLKDYFSGKSKEVGKLAKGCFNGSNKMSNLTSSLIAALHSRNDHATVKATGSKKNAPEPTYRHDLSTNKTSLASPRKSKKKENKE